MALYFTSSEEYLNMVAAYARSGMQMIVYCSTPQIYQHYRRWLEDNLPDDDFNRVQIEIVDQRPLPLVCEDEEPACWNRNTHKALTCWFRHKCKGACVKLSGRA